MRTSWWPAAASRDTKDALLMMECGCVTLLPQETREKRHDGDVGEGSMLRDTAPVDLQGKASEESSTEKE